jgi:hypothetical protein
MSTALSLPAFFPLPDFKLVRRVRAMSANILVRVAATPADLDATRAVRHRVYCTEKRFLRPDELLDEYDARATVVNAFDGADPVGSMRITDSAEGCLEILEMHPELAGLLPPKARLLEVSRLMAIRSHRGLRTTVPLFRVVVAEMLARKADGILVSCAKGLIPYYETIGFRLLSTEPLAHHRLAGLKDYPMIFEWPKVLAYGTPSRLSLWLAINPFWALRGMLATTARLLWGGR